MNKKLIAAAISAIAVGSMLIAAPAMAGGKDKDMPQAGKSVTLAEGLFMPLSLAVERNGSVYVSQNAAGILTRVGPDKKTATDIVSFPGDEVAAVSVGKNSVYYALTSQDHSESILYTLPKKGDPVALADIAAYESRVNPDQINTYGFVDLPESCAEQFDPTAPPFVPATYTGIIDTHAYTSVVIDSSVYIADAGANAILRVDKHGTISTTAVLPPTAPVTATADLIAQFGFPTCATGYGYRFEPVPTGIAVGPDGWLYVASLPGGPEDPSLGARGSLVKINPDSGQIRQVAGGLVGPTGVAVSPKSGNIYVAELFGGPTGTGQVSVITRGATTPKVLMAVTSPAAIAVNNNDLFVTTNAFVPDANGAPQPIGTVTRYTLK